MGSVSYASGCSQIYIFEGFPSLSCAGLPYRQRHSSAVDIRTCIEDQTMKTKPFISYLLAALVMLASTLCSRAQNEVSFYAIKKIAAYNQSGVSNIPLDPEFPYRFQVYMDAPRGSASTLLSSSTVTPPAGSTETLRFQSGTQGIRGQKDFMTKADMDAAFPSGVYGLTIKASTGVTYQTQVTLPADNYPAIPQVTGVTNASWNNGRLVVSDYTKAVTITWSNPGNANSVYFSVWNTGINTYGSGATYTNSYTIPGNSLPNNSLYKVYIGMENYVGGSASEVPNSGYNASHITQNVFFIQTGTPVAADLGNEIKKRHTVVQTSNSVPADGAGHDDYYTPAPYDMYLGCTSAGSVTGPESNSYALGFSAEDDDVIYVRSSGAVTSKAALDAAYPNGTYTFPNGAQVNLTGDVYPNSTSPQQVTLVNGATPVWNSQGQLVLDPTIENVITWTPYSISSGTFAANGYIKASFEGDYGDNVNVSRTAGLSTSNPSPINTLTISANSMTVGHTYVGRIAHTNVAQYTQVNGAFYVAEYETRTYFTAVAATPAPLIYGAVKQHVMVQTNHEALYEATANVVDPSPYNFYSFSPTPGSVSAPSNVSYTLSFNSSDSTYKFQSIAYLSAADMATTYADGGYTLADGFHVLLTGGASLFPSSPRVMSVNGSTPTWNMQGQLVLNSTIHNTITWTFCGFDDFISRFPSKGQVNVKLTGNQDSVNIQKKAFGPIGEAVVTSLFIPANTLTPGNTYNTSIANFLASSISKSTSCIFDLAGYETETYFAVAAASLNKPQTITFPAIDHNTTVGYATTLGATASSGLPVTYTLSGPATLNGSVITFTGVGYVTIYANQIGNSTYAPAATVSQTYYVSMPQDVQNYSICKEMNFVQSGASAPVPDPKEPYHFVSFVDSGSGSSWTFLSSSTLTLPSGSKGPFAYKSGSDGLRGRYNFSTKAAMDAAFGSGTYDLTIYSTKPATYNAQLTLGSDNYPNVPQVTGVTNATWVGTRLVITDITKDVTITWSNPLNCVGHFGVLGSSVNAPYGTVMSSYTIPGGSLQDNSLYTGEIELSNFTGSSSTAIPGAYAQAGYQVNNVFVIQTGIPTPPSSTYNMIRKMHTVVQTSNSAPSNETGHDDDFDRAPYFVEIRCSTAGAVTCGTNSYPLSYDERDHGRYYYSSGALTSQAAIDAAIPNGTYTLPSGGTATITGDVYPNASNPPQVTLVNGLTPVWNAQGQLVLDPTIANTITFTPYNGTNGSYTFATGGYESVEFSGTYGDDLDLMQEAGVSVGTTATFNTLTIPVNSMKLGHTYTGCIEYFLASSMTTPSANVYNIAGYVTKTYFTAVAASATTVTLGNLSAIYDGTPKAVTVTTTPAGRNVLITYDGSTTPPTAPGSYAVVATIHDGDYQGGSTGTLVIANNTYTLNTNITSASVVPVTASSYRATGGTVNLALNFAPPAGTTLTIVKNTGLDFIQGAYANLAQGQKVTLTYGGKNYDFVANYFGGTGNDLVLQWANVRPFGWGDNQWSQLGNGRWTNSLVPTPTVNSGILSGKTVTALSANGSHSIALCADGTVASWGHNLSYQLGNSSMTNSVVPVKVEPVGALAGKTVAAVSAGGGHSMALCSDGTVAAWGSNGYGALGNNSTETSDIPVWVDTTGALSGKKVASISAGSGHNLALCTDGTIVAWGNNTSGLLGNTTLGAGSVSRIPVFIDQSGILYGKTVVAISAGGSHNLALCSDGTLAAWGSGSYGQLGNNSMTSSTSPVPVITSGVLSGKTIVAISAGDIHSLALCSDGTVVAWGGNGYGQLGNNSTTSSSVPVLVFNTGGFTGKSVIAISAGRTHSLGYCSDGTIVAWGKNYECELGNNSRTNSSIPVQVSTYGLASGEGFISAVTGPGAIHSQGLIAYTPSFQNWSSAYFNSTQLADPLVSGATVAPQKDGVPNLLKHLYNIDPSRPMTVADRNALPEVDMPNISGTDYLTLSYRQNANLSGVTVLLQTSTDMKTWTTVTPDISGQISTDASTGDPIMRVGVTPGTGRKFIRLNVVAP